MKILEKEPGCPVWGWARLISPSMGALHRDAMRHARSTV
jgi:hypothetical protein